MASLFGALGSLAQSYGNALELHRQQQQQEQQGALQQLYAKLEQGRLAEEQQRTQIEAARERREALAARRPIALGGTYKVGGKQMQRFWDPDAKGGAGGFLELQEGDVDDPVKEFQRRFQDVHGKPPTPEQVDAAVLGLKPPAAEQGYELKQDRNGRWIYMRKDPTAKGGELVIPSSVIGKLPKEAAGEVELPEKTVAALADRWNKYGDKPPAKFQVQVETYMEDHHMAPGRKLNAREQGILQVVKQAQPRIDTLKKLIEDNGLTDDNSFLLSSHSAVMQHLRSGSYKFGVEPEKLTSELMKNAAAIRVMGIAPWTIIGRGKWSVGEITQHLPAITDTPGFLYDKVQFFQNIIDDAKADISGAGAIEDSGAKTGLPNMAIGKDFGPAPSGKADGSTGTLSDGTKVVVRRGRLVGQ